MANLRTILVVGRDPYLVTDVLRNAGYVGTAGFQIVEAGGFDAAERALNSDQSIVALVSCDRELHDGVRILADRKELPRAMSNGDDGRHKIPAVLEQQFEFVN